MTNRIQAVLTANATGFNRTLNDAARSAGDFGRRVERQFAGINRGFAALAGAAATGVAAGALENLAKSALNAAGEISDAAKAAGISSQALQEYREAARLSGIEVAQLDKAVATFTRQLGEARTGNRALAETFRRIGVTAQDTAETALQKAFTALAGISDQAVRASVAADLFGARAQRMTLLVENGAEGLASTRREINRLGLVLRDDLVVSAEEAGDRIENLERQMQTRLQRAVLENISGFEAYKRLLNDISRGTIAAAAAIGNLSSAIERQIAIANRSAVSDTATTDELLLRRGRFAEAIAANDRQIARNRVNADNILPGIAQAAQRNIDQLTADNETLRRRVAEIDGIIARQISTLAAAPPPASAIANGENALGVFAGAGAAPRNPFPGLSGPTLKTDAIARNLESAQQRIAQIAEQTRTPLETLRDNLAELDRLRPFAENAEQVIALDRAAEGLREQMRALNEASRAWGVTIEETTRGLSDAFADAIVRGESLLGTLKRLVQQLAARVLSNFLFRTIGGVFGLPFGGAREGGGPVQSGRAFLVGERGPEIFTPSVSGTVIPNGANLGGGVMVNVTNRFDVGLETVSDRIATMTPAIAASVVDAVQRAQARPRFA